MCFVVSLVATGNVEFEGYIIQGRLVNNTDTIVGTFSEPESGRFHSCNPKYVSITIPLVCYNNMPRYRGELLTMDMDMMMMDMDMMMMIMKKMMMMIMKKVMVMMMMMMMMKVEVFPFSGQRQLKEMGASSSGLSTKMIIVCI